MAYLVYQRRKGSDKVYAHVRTSVWEDGTAPSTGAVYVFGPGAETIGQISSVSSTDIGLRITIPPAPGRRVGVEFSPDLSPGSWVELGNFFDDGGDWQFTDPDFIRLRDARGYYRAFLRQRLP